MSAPVPPRVLRVVLDECRPGRVLVPPRHGWRDPRLERVGAWGGAALGLALLAAEPEAGPLVLAVGHGVRAGVPTAARASVLARAPLSGLLAEGQVGGELGARLARVADALVVVGRAPIPDAVLVVDGRGVELVRVPELGGRPPRVVLPELGRRFAPSSALVSGPAAASDCAFASLASGDERPSFVGRGGLGAVLARLGLVAIVVRADVPLQSAAAEAPELRAALLRSPRLAARAAGGTFELFGALSARGDLRAGDRAEALSGTRGAELFAEAQERRRGREGCRGCPTPCGWVFEQQHRPQRARFGATEALGTSLGLTAVDDAFALLALCDDLGLDAKEAGAVLATTQRARERGRLPGEPRWGDRAGLAAELAALLGDGELARQQRAGAVALARHLGLADELPQARGQAARASENLANVLGQCVSAGGTDPMRSFPFLVDACDRERMGRLVAPLPLPPEAADAGSPAGKGRLVFWHENLVAGLDAVGFCAFSAAGLLADGVLDVDELARSILPPSLERPRDADWRALAPGERLLAAGANIVLLRRELNRRYGADAGPGPPTLGARGPRSAGHARRVPRPARPGSGRASRVCPLLAARRRGRAGLGAWTPSRRRRRRPGDARRSPGRGGPAAERPRRAARGRRSRLAAGALAGARAAGDGDRGPACRGGCRRRARAPAPRRRASDSQRVARRPAARALRRGPRGGRPGARHGDRGRLGGPSPPAPRAVSAPARTRRTASSGLSARATRGSTSQEPRATTGLSALQGEGDLRQGPVAAAHRHEGLGRVGQDGVACVAHPRRHDDPDVAVGEGRIVTREDAEHHPSRVRGPTRGGLHHAAEPAGDEHAAGLRDETADRARHAFQLRTAVPGADHADDPLRFARIR